MLGRTTLNIQFPILVRIESLRICRLNLTKESILAQLLANKNRTSDDSFICAVNY